MANENVKIFAKEKKVYLWRVAEHMGIQDSALSRKLRKELPPEEKERILAAIDRLAKEDR